jgi:hypothetical protein
MADWRELNNLSTLELICLMKIKENKSDLEMAKSAFHVFTFRFMLELTKKCEIICKNWGKDAEFASEVSNETFQRFWKYPNFDPIKSSTKNIDKGVLFYLFRIASNILIDKWHKKFGIKITPYDGSEEIVMDFPKNSIQELGDNEDLSSHQAIVKNILSGYSEKHKIIFLTYSKYEEKGFKLPRGLLLSLRERLNLSQQTIRSYKNEVNNKIAEHLRIYGNRQKKH